MIRNLCDFPVACHFLKLGPFGSHPHGHFGMLGAVSSSISLYEMWPTVRDIASTHDEFARCSTALVLICLLLLSFFCQIVVGVPAK